MSGILRSLFDVVGRILGVVGGLFGAVLGLFRKSREEATLPEAKEGQQAASNAYFLSADDAITLGNVDYMRSSKSSRRTFPKAKLGLDNAFVQTVSSIKKADLKAQAIAEAKLPTLSEQPKSDRRRADSSLDKFRNMARDLKKE